MKLFRTKPVQIKAAVWPGWARNPETLVDPAVDAVVQQIIGDGNFAKCKDCGLDTDSHGWVKTLGGGHRACPGDWIIQTEDGHFVSCKPEFFAAAYDAVDEVG